MKGPSKAQLLDECFGIMRAMHKSQENPEIEKMFTRLYFVIWKCASLGVIDSMEYDPDNNQNCNKVVGDLTEKDPLIAGIRLEHLDWDRVRLLSEIQASSVDHNNERNQRWVAVSHTKGRLCMRLNAKFTITKHTNEIRFAKDHFERIEYLIRRVSGKRTHNKFNLVIIDNPKEQSNIPQVYVMPRVQEAIIQFRLIVAMGDGYFAHYDSLNSTGFTDHSLVCRCKRSEKKNYKTYACAHRKFIASV